MESSNKTLFGVLSYLGPLVIISYLSAKDDQFVKFHVKQGLVVFGIEILAWVLITGFLWQFMMLVPLINLATIVLSIIGIMNVLQQKEKELPLVGQLARSINI